jgi:hypothetical protein
VEINETAASKILKKVRLVSDPIGLNIANLSVVGQNIEGADYCRISLPASGN